MNYIFANSKGTLTDVGAADAVAAWPATACLAIEKLSTTTLEVHLQAHDNTADAGHITLKHADTTAEATLNCSRALIDEVVSTINNNNRNKVGVLVDAVNNVALTNGLLTSNVVDEA
tara:strand:+ start:3151 stop:3501 length:351 start_codon:yes stop_codon:yes gene_type:complete